MQLARRRRDRENAMVSDAKLARMDATVRAFLAKEFAHAPTYQGNVLQLWERYRALGLPNDDFVVSTMHALE